MASMVNKATTTTATAVTRIVLTDVSSVAYSTSGTTRIFTTSDPTSDTEWSDIAALYQEYRTAALEMEFIPTFVNSTAPVGVITSVAGGAWLSIENHGATVAGTLTVTTADEFADTLAIHPVDSRFRRAMVFNGPGEKEWTNTNVSPVFPYEAVAASDFELTITGSV